MPYKYPLTPTAHKADDADDIEADDVDDEVADRRTDIGNAVVIPKRADGKGNAIVEYGNMSTSVMMHIWYFEACSIYRIQERRAPKNGKS